MKKIAKILLVAVFALLLVGCGDEEMGNVYKAQIEIENYGTIELELYEKYAPITVNNFITLANNHFYDGLTFHRIIRGFMIQGGDPSTRGTGERPASIKGEFINNGVYNELKHVRGVISMARVDGDNDSASSQFFIVHQDSPHLDGDYAAFGKVTKGMGVVDRICSEVKVEDNNGTVLRENQPVIKSIKIIN